MADIKTVLCPIDFSDLSRRELSLATEVCVALGARLVMHHNLSEIAPGLTRQWEWDQFHRADYLSVDETEARLRALLAEVPEGVAAEATVSRGPVVLVLLDMAARLPADLVVLGYHGLKDLDHASVTERMLDQCNAPLLTIHEGAMIDRFKLRGEMVPVLVPIESADGPSALAQYAFDLARRLPLHVHLLHVMSSVASSAAGTHHLSHRPRQRRRSHPRGRRAPARRFHDHGRAQPQPAGQPLRQGQRQADSREGGLPGVVRAARALSGAPTRPAPGPGGCRSATPGTGCV